SRRDSLMTVDVILRRARPEDAEAISRLIAAFAADALMLKRTPEMVELAIDDYVVGVNRRGEIVACGALEEYSPSVGEVAAVAVSRGADGCGGGRAVGRAVEGLALERGLVGVFAVAVRRALFSAVGSAGVDRARSPEKIRPDCVGWARRFACSHTCFAK